MPNTTKYALKGPNYPHWRQTPPPYPQNVDKNNVFLTLPYGSPIFFLGDKFFLRSS